jgi:hypothetical protein
MSKTLLVVLIIAAIAIALAVVISPGLRDLNPDEPPNSLQD